VLVQTANWRFNLIKYLLVRYFGPSARIIGIVFIKRAAPDLNRFGFIVKVIAFLEQADNVIAGIDPIGKAYYPKDNRYIEPCSCLGRDFSPGWQYDKQQQSQTCEKINFIIGKKVYEIVQHYWGAFG